MSIVFVTTPKNMESNTTPNDLDPDIWIMPPAVHTSATVILIIEIASSVLSNALLIVTICYSPSLKTPPNAQLVSICVNNLLLCLSAVISLASILSNSHHVLWTVFNDMQMFVSLICLMQYWCIFSAIGFYRTKILERPSMPLRLRRRIIRCSIWVGWLTSVGASLLLTLCYRGQTASMNWNPFRTCIRTSQLHKITSPKAHQMILLFLISVGYVIGVFGIVLSYQRIFKTLYAAKPLAKNRVAPFTATRASSLSSDDNDLTFSSRRSYRPAMEEVWSQRSPFTISNGNLTEDAVVHYQRCQDVLTFEIYALENPMQFHANNLHRVTPGHRQLQPSLSNASNASTRSRIIEFNDISPAGELNRIQNIKNSTALWSQSLRRDRVSLKAATTNSLVMLATYTIFSVPYVLCCLPGVVPTSSVGSLTIPLLYSRLLFYLNGPAYPIWYLVFSSRVRKCLYKLFETVLISLNLKK